MGPHHQMESSHNGTFTDAELAEALNLKIGCIFEILCVSALGYVTPLLFRGLSKDGFDMLQSDFFSLLKAFSGGIIIGVAIMHLLADSIADLADVYEYPVSLALLILGLLFSTGIEQLAIFLPTYFSEAPIVVSQTNGEKSGGADNSGSAENQTNTYKHVHNNTNHDVLELPVSSIPHEEKSAYHYHEHVHSTSVAITKAIVLEATIGLHSVLIGYAVGLIAADGIESIRILMIAFGFHQFFEGISLGTVLVESTLNSYYIAFFGFIFSLSMPIGVIIGITTEETDQGTLTGAVVNAIAAGCLVYSGLVEMAAEDFADPRIAQRPVLKFLMFVALAAGCSVMAILAIWG